MNGTEWMVNGRPRIRKLWSLLCGCSLGGMTNGSFGVLISALYYASFWSLSMIQNIYWKSLVLPVYLDAKYPSKICRPIFHCILDKHLFCSSWHILLLCTLNLLLYMILVSYCYTWVAANCFTCNLRIKNHVYFIWFTEMAAKLFFTLCFVKHWLLRQHWHLIHSKTRFNKLM